MAVAWNDFEWIISFGEAYDLTDQKLWTDCNQYDISVLGCDVDVPKPKRSYVSIPYRDGDLCLTSDDDVKYENRRVVLNFESTGTLENARKAQTAFWNHYHGKTGFLGRKRSGSMGYYGYDIMFYGQMEVSDFDINDSTYRFSIQMDAFPYRIRSMTTVTPLPLDVYDSVATLPGIPSYDSTVKMLVAVEFDPDFLMQCSGVTLVADDNPVGALITPFTQSKSVFNANLLVKNVATGTNTFILRATPINPSAGVLNAKLLIRVMMVQL